MGHGGGCSDADFVNEAAAQQEEQQPQIEDAMAQEESKGEQ